MANGVSENLIQRPGSRMAALIESMRISHWIKNSFVAAPIIFSGQFVQLQAWGRCLAAVTAYCLLSSSVYIINDIADRNRDRLHPVKRNRPVASGRLGIGSAMAAAVILLVCGLGIAVAVEFFTYDPGRPLHGMGLVVWTGLYLALNLLYSFWLKTRAMVDVIAVALGFVLRAMAGAAAISVPISPWLVICTFSLCLFIALAKRRSEILTLSVEQAAGSREVNRSYEPIDLEHMLTVSSALAIVTYALYCVAPQTVSRIGSAHMIWTIPLVVYGMFRYNRTTRMAARSDAVSVLVRDRIMWAVMIVYLAIVMLVLTFGAHDAVRPILDVQAGSR